MALIECPECCQSQVSDKAKKCPKCGCTICDVSDKEYIKKDSKTKEISKKQIIKYIVVGLVLLSAMVFAFVYISKNTKYKKAIKLQQNGDYDEAIEMFEHLGSFRNARTEIKETKYLKAINLRENAEYIESIQLFKELGAYKDSEEQVTETAYTVACSAYNLGFLGEAYQLLMYIDGYKDSNEMLNDILSRQPYVYLVNAEVGDEVVFGNEKYSNIWTVMDKDDDKLLLVNKNCIDTMKFNNEKGDVSWYSSSLRERLNKYYYNMAFSVNEKSLIYPVILDEHSSLTVLYSVAGENVEDLVFVLSVEEAEKYFDSDESRKTSYQNKRIDWWLRDQGDRSFNIAFVDQDGKIDSRGYAADKFERGVRPALWLDLTFYTP